jgi:hypothetical protein
MLLLPEEKTGKVWEPSKSNVFSEIAERWIETFLHPFRLPSVNSQATV